MAALPRFIALRSNHVNKHYLQFVGSDEGINGLLRFIGDQVASPFTKLEVKPAKTGDGLVHLKSCYNNNYLVRQAQNSLWIVVGANEEEENQSKWSYTLFKPIIDEKARTVQFIHVQLGFYINIYTADDAAFTNGLYAATPKEASQASLDTFEFIDLDSMFVFQNYVAFKIPGEGHLSARLNNGRIQLQITSQDLNDPTVANEVFINPDGTIRVKSNFFNKFWRRSDDRRAWVLADADDDANNKDSLFWPIKLDNNVVALRNLGNNNFCRRFMLDYTKSFLSAYAPTTNDVTTRLHVTELVAKREIYDAEYGIRSAKSSKYITLQRISVANDSYDEQVTRVLKFSYENSEKNTWNSNASHKLFDVVNLRVSIPDILGQRPSMNNFEGEYKWGETKDDFSCIVKSVYRIQVPPRKIKVVELVATVGSFEIPFSYTQKDTLINGKHVEYEMKDGIYTTIAHLNTRYVVQEESMDRNKSSTKRNLAGFYSLE